MAWLKGPMSLLVAVLALLHVSPASAQEDPNLSCPWPGPAQFLTRRASPPDSISLRVGDSVVKVCYSRPSARDRQVMGALVPYGREWRTGANEMTVILVTAAVEVAGVHLEPGRYVFHSIPGPNEWTFLFYHADGDSQQEIVTSMVEHARGIVPASQTDQHVETLTFHGLDGATQGALILEWEHTRIHIPVIIDLRGPVSFGAVGCLTTE